MPFQLVYFSSVLLIAGACTLLQPFSPSLLTLTGLRFAAYFSAGFFGAVNIALFVYTMGPVRSRPYTMMIHLLVGVGWSGHGWAISPAVGQLMADWVMTGYQPDLLKPFNYERFKS